MSVSIAALVLVSAFLHPVWNALVKRDLQPEAAFIGIALMLVILGAGHAWIAGQDLLSVGPAWPLMAISAAGEFLYGTFLVITLRRGDLSAYYPIVRSSPLFVVVVGVLFLGHRYTWVLLAGIALVMIGAFALQYKRGVRLLDDPVTLLCAALSMAGTGIYSLSDAMLMQVVAPPVRQFWTFSLSLPGYVLVFHALGGRSLPRPELFAFVRKPLRALAIGVVCYLSYVLILTAYEWGGDVAAVTTVRQASIPLSVVIGALWLKERSLTQRFWASLLLASGIVVIVLAS